MVSSNNTHFRIKILKHVFHIKWTHFIIIFPLIDDQGGESSSKSSGREVDPLSLDSEIITLDSDDGDDAPLPPQPVKPKPIPSERPKREVWICHYIIQDV